MWNPFKRSKPTTRRKRGGYKTSFAQRNSDLSSLMSLASGADQTLKPDTRPIAQVIKDELATDRGKTRGMERSNPYLCKYFKLLEGNVIGSAGFHFQSKILRSNGDYNTPLNDKVEAWWKEQTKPENYTTQGESSGLDSTAGDKLILRMIARDGFVLIRMVDNFDNKTGFAIQLISGSALDHTLNVGKLKGGSNSIVNGVELDEWERVVAYHLHAKNGTGSVDAKHKREDAKDIICPFIKATQEQQLGMPWPATILDTLHGLDKFEEAVLQTAREAACRGIFYKQNELADGDLEADDLDQDLRPGMATLLPLGVDAHNYDPSQPTDTYGDYRSGLLMRAAAGGGISYQSFSTDLSKGNFASQRVGVLDERDEWKSLQEWFITSVKKPVFQRALRMAMLRLDLPPSTTYSQLNKGSFLGRRWDWVDPERDVNSAIKRMEHGLTSRERVIAEYNSGVDEEQMLQEIKRGQKTQQALGLSLPDRHITLEQEDAPVVQEDGTVTPTADDTAKADARELATTVQKIYLGVGKVVTAEEAREIINEAGGKLPDDLPESLKPTTPEPAESNE